MNKSTRKAPEIRFKGFSEDWEQRKLGEISDSFSGGTPSVGNKSYYGGKIPFIRSGEINSESTELFITKDGINNSSAKMVDRGDILYALYGATSGEVSISRINGAVNQAILAIKPNLDNNSYFITQWLKNHQEKIIRTYLQGGQGNLSGSIVKNLILKMPSDIVEQDQIGEFIKQLDNTITLHQRKLDLLKQFKQGYLQNMFPQQGESVPKLRFANFGSVWEQRKLGELADIVRGASPRPIQNPKWFDKNSDVGWLRISDVTEQDGRIHYLKQKISKAGQEKTRVLIETHLLLSIAATVGKPVINYVKTGVHDGFLIFMNPIFHQEFMFQWLEMFRPKWKKYGQPGSQVNLNSELVRNQQMKISSFKEQKSIGMFLKQLDTNISLHQIKLDKLQSLKKAYLQKMFI